MRDSNVFGLIVFVDHLRSLLVMWLCQEEQLLIWIHCKYQTGLIINYYLLLIIQYCSLFCSRVHALKVCNINTTKLCYFILILLSSFV